MCVLLAQTEQESKATFSVLTKLDITQLPVPTEILVTWLCPQIFVENEQQDSHWALNVTVFF